MEAESRPQSEPPEQTIAKVSPYASENARKGHAKGSELYACAFFGQQSAELPDPS